MVQCPACRSPIDEDTKICPFCGSSTKRSMSFGNRDRKDDLAWIDELKEEIDSYWANHADFKAKMDQSLENGMAPETEAGTDSMENMNSEMVLDAMDLDRMDSEMESESMDGMDPELDADDMGDMDPELEVDDMDDMDPIDDEDDLVSSNTRRPRRGGTFHKSEEDRRRARRRNMILASILGIVIVGILVAIFAISSIKPKVELNQYISFKTDGYDSAGQAIVELREDEIHDAYAKKVENSDQMLEECIDYEINPDSNLSNGDVVTLTWKCDDQKAKEIYGCILEYSDQTFVVEDLDEGESFDPFEGVKVTFEGMNGQGTASYDAKASKNVKKMNLSFTFDKSENLSNDDVVVLSLENVKDDDTSEFLKEYGMVPSPLRKEFTVSGLDTYVTSSDQLTDEAIRVMKEKGEKYYKSQLSEEFTSEGEEYKGIDYQGYYLLNAKDSKNTNPVNKVYLVYKAHVLNTAHPYHQDNVIYWYIRFSNLSVDEKSENNIDLEDYKTPEETFNITLGSGWQKASWYYHGYASLDDLYMAVVADQSDDYAHEENVHDDGVGPGEVIKEEDTTEATTEDTTEEASTEKKEETGISSQSEADQEGIIFPDSSGKYLTQADVANLSKEEIRSATNEIFARAGYIFKDSSLADYYKQYSWYQPKVPSDQFDMEVHMNEIERANVILLEKERQSR